MTIAERNKKLKHFITCLKCEVGGKLCDDNCPTQYFAGNMGEIIENLEAISKAIEQQTCEDCVSRQAVLDAVDTYDKFGYTKTGCFVRNPKGDYVPYIHYDDVIKCVKNMPPVTPEPLNPEADREESKDYCAECDHIEMCSWYPHDGCEWRKTDRYNAGYNAAKREIALSGEYERAYERGKADVQPKMGRDKGVAG